MKRLKIEPWSQVQSLHWCRRLLNVYLPKLLLPLLSHHASYGRYSRAAYSRMCSMGYTVIHMDHGHAFVYLAAFGFVAMHYQAKSSADISNAHKRSEAHVDLGSQTLQNMAQSYSSAATRRRRCSAASSRCGSSPPRARCKSNTSNSSTSRFNALDHPC